MSAARLPEPANAAAMRSRPSDCWLALVMPLWADPGRVSPLRQDLGQVLVAAPTQAQQVAVGVARDVEDVVERVRGLERRDDPLEPGDLAEGGQRVVVGDGDIARAAGVAQPGVLGPGAGVVE